MTTYTSSVASFSIPSDTSFPEFVTKRLLQHKTKIALINAHTREQYSFEDVYWKIIKLGSALRRQGFSRGSIACIYSPNSIDYPIVTLAVTSVGGIVTTASPLNSADELGKQLDNCGANWIFSGEEVMSKADAACRKRTGMQMFVLGKAVGFTSLSTLYKDNGDLFEFARVDANDVMTLLYSSGTTGGPKGVMGTHQNFLACLLSTCSAETAMFANPHNEVVLVSLPQSHIYAISWTFNFFYLGETLILMRKFDLDLSLRCIEKYRVTTLLLVPPVVTMFNNSSHLSQFDVSSLKNVFSAAAPLRIETAEIFYAKTGAIIRQGFGMTEATGGVTHNFIGCGKQSSGQLLPGWQAKIVDTETGALLKAKEDGELCIRGLSLMKGYFNDAAANKQAFDDDGWFHTGDIGHFDEDGHLYITGRLKELIKCNAYQVAPAELEALLCQHPAIVDAAVIGVPHPLMGEVPKAFVVKRQGEVVSETEVVSYIQDKVAPYKRLRGGVSFLLQIPRLPSGKILRRLLTDENAMTLQSKL